MEACAFGSDCCICGYHVHKNIWQASMGEKLECDREPDNSCDHFSEESTWQGMLDRSNDRTNVRSSNYSPWNIFHLF